MKIFLIFFFLTKLSQAAVTGVTEGCPEKMQIIANEGEKFVTVKTPGRDEKLISVTGAPFSLQGKDPVIFRNNNLEFEMTSVVMSSLPRLTLRNAGIQKKCMVNFYGTTN